MSTMIINGKELFVETYGDPKNPCIAILHGGPGATCVDFLRLYEPLSRDYYIVAFDQLGCGRSGPVEEGGSFGMPQHVELIEALRRKLGIQQWTIWGHSYGGMLAAYYANVCSESVNAVIYECPGWDFVDSMRNICQYYIDRYLEPNHMEEGIAEAKAYIAKDFSTDPGSAVWDFLKMQRHIKDMDVLFYLYGTTIEDYMADWVTLNIDEAAADAGAMAHLQNLVKEGTIMENMLPRIAQNQQPAILMEGEFDPACSTKQQVFFKEKAPNGQTHIFKNCGHTPRLECKEEFVEAVKTFMAQLA